MKLAPMLPTHDRAIAAGADQTSDAGTIKRGPGSRRGCRIHIVTTKTSGPSQPRSMRKASTSLVEIAWLSMTTTATTTITTIRADTRRTIAKYAAVLPQAVLLQR
jgi:hypothetical protein